MAYALKYELTYLRFVAILSNLQVALVIFSEKMCSTNNTFHYGMNSKSILVLIQHYHHGGAR